MDPTTYPAELAELKIELEHQEVALEIIHKHWGKVLWPLVGLSTAIFISFILLIFVISNSNFSALTLLYIFIIGLIWELALLGYTFSEWLSYKRSALILTNQRIIDCQQINFLSRRLQVIDIHEIQSCVGQAAPIWGVFLDYGDLSINTVGDRPICISYIPSPEKMSGLIMHHHNLIAHGRLDLRTNLPVNSDKTMKDLNTDDPDSLTLVMFHIERHKLEAIRNKLPAQKEPSLIYLAHSGYYEAEIIIPTKKVKETVKFLKEHGAEDIVGGHVLHKIT